MGDEYLWDRTGEPDPDVARLERTLSSLRYEPRSFEAPRARVIPIRRPLRRWLFLAAAAAIVAGIVVWRGSHLAAVPVAVAPSASTTPAIEAPAFPVERLEGASRVNAAPIEATARLGVGQWLETDRGARARIAVADIGAVEVAEKSRVRLTKTGPDQHRLDLERGVISAKVDAPPRLFVVGTPAATAVDLGCAYTLEVDDDGRGLLRVTSGWVALEDGGKSSLVPAGAACWTRPGQGPGTPTYEDAPAALREALARFDFENGGAAAVDAILASARPRDTLTLWHVLQRVDGALRAKVFARARAFVPLPADAAEADVLRLDPTALSHWRDAITVALARITW